jgi:hypothetical protein
MDMKSTFRSRYTSLVVIMAAGIISAIGVAHADGWRDDDDQLAQVAELEQLHATPSEAAEHAETSINTGSGRIITLRIGK